MKRQSYLFLFALMPYSLSLYAAPSGRSNYAGAYNEVAQYQAMYQYEAQRQAEAVASPNEALPVRVADEELARQIITGTPNTPVVISELDSCAMIYPGGVFEWARPTAGLRAGSPATCVSVVEMRAIKGTEDIILARVNLAAGDSLECNISKWSAESYLPAAGEIIFPADRAPTIEDVRKRMDEEQKKGQGLKIAAGAVIGGLLGNVSGKNDLGSSSVIGTDKGKMQGTLVGALGGAGLMAASASAGKVGGDIIMSAGVNAAAGAAIGNIMATGDAVLRIEDCIVGGIATQCLWGVIEKNKPLDTATEAGFYNISTGETIVCKEGGTKKCNKETLIGLQVTGYTSIEQGKADQNFQKIRNANQTYKFDDKTNEMLGGSSSDDWILLSSAGRPGNRSPAMIRNFKDSAFGQKLSDWHKSKSKFNNSDIVGRGSKGEELPRPIIESEKWEITDFYPITIDSGDGGIIDMSNKARLGGTLTGAGVGAGMGALTAYQGAQDEITERWTTSVQEYKDSLQKIYCATGTRFLVSYNDIIAIPNMH